MFPTRIRYVTYIPRELRHEIHIRLLLIRKRFEKQSKRSCVVTEGFRHRRNDDRRVIHMYRYVLYHNRDNGISEEINVSAKWAIRFTIIPSIRAIQRAA